jgi:hypothetical protein
LRPDDNPEVLRTRIIAYRELTAPLVDHYQAQGILRSVNGMAPIGEVAAAIDSVLAAASPKKATRKKPAAKALAVKGLGVKALGVKTLAAKPAVAKAVGRKKPAAVRSGRVSAAAKSGSKAAIRGKTTLRKSKSRRG